MSEHGPLFADLPPAPAPPPAAKSWSAILRASSPEGGLGYSMRVVPRFVGSISASSPLEAGRRALQSIKGRKGARYDCAIVLERRPPDDPIKRLHGEVSREMIRARTRWSWRYSFRRLTAAEREHWRGQSTRTDWENWND